MNDQEIDNIKNCTVCLIFNFSMTHILLLKRYKNPYKDKYNGVGGKIEKNEKLEVALWREIYEETGFIKEDFLKTEYLMQTYHPKSGYLLHIYYHILNQNKEYKIENGLVTNEGELNWITLQENFLFDVRNLYLAGEGNIAYFINAALEEERNN